MTVSAVGVVGDAALADRITAAVDSEGATVVDGTASEVLADDPDAVVAVGESALLALVREGVSVPVLPVAAGPGYGGVPGGDATADVADSTDTAGATDDPDDSRVVPAVERLLADEYATETRATLGVSVDGERVGRALADVMLVATEPARISEYAVRSRDETVAQFRADGVAVSTPTGSHGYGRSAGGPLIEPGSGVVGVVPVAPFAVNVDRWVVSADRPVTLTVERDESEVSLLVDDRTVRPVPPHAPVEVVEDAAVAVVRVPESRPFFER